MRPDLALDPGGRAIAVWWDEEFRQRVFEPVESPLPGDGMIVFSSDRDGDDEIYSMGPGGAPVNRWTGNDAADRDPVWSPDRSRIAFLSNRDGPSPGLDLYVMEVTVPGLPVTRLTYYAGDLGNVRDPAWSPDGGALAFRAFTPGGTRIFRVTVEGTFSEEIANQESGNDAPDWR